MVKGVRWCCWLFLCLSKQVAPGIRVAPLLLGHLGRHVSFSGEGNHTRPQQPAQEPLIASVPCYFGLRVDSKGFGGINDGKFNRAVRPQLRLARTTGRRPCVHDPGENSMNHQHQEFNVPRFTPNRTQQPLPPEFSRTTLNSHHHNFTASDVSLFCLTESVANCNPEPLTRGGHGTSNSEFAHRSFTHLGRSVLPSGFCGVAMADPHATAGDIPANQYLAMRPGCGGCPRPVSTSAGRFRSILTRRAGASVRISASCQCRSAACTPAFSRHLSHAQRIPVSAQTERIPRAEARAPSTPRIAALVAAARSLLSDCQIWRGSVSIRNPRWQCGAE